MLGKLIKYDLKWIYKPLLVFYVLCLVFSLLARALSGIENSIVFNILTQVCYSVAISMAFSIIINNLMRCWGRVIRNMYKDESYLTHTLPVKNQDVFWAKVLSGIITMITSFAVIALCFVIAYGTKNNWELIKTLCTPMTDLLGISLAEFVCIIIGILALEFLFMLVSGYLGIIIGHKLNNAKIVKSVIYGFAAFLVMGITTVGLLYIVGLFNSNIMNLFKTTEAPNAETLRILLIGGSILYVLYTIVYSIIGSKILKKGVNVD